MKIKHWKPQQKKPNTFFIDALKIVCVIRHHLKIPVKYRAINTSGADGWQTVERTMGVAS